MPTIAEIRQKYPQYQDLSDDQLAQGLHKKFYSDLSFEDFSKRIGLSTAPQILAADQLSQPEAVAAYDQKYANVAPEDRPPRLPSESPGPSPAPTPFRGVRDYAGSVLDALRKADQTRAPGQFLPSTLDAAFSAARGAVATPFAGIYGAARGDTPAEEAQYADQFVSKASAPFSQGGRDILGAFGAALSPVTNSGLDVALGPLFAGESQAARVPSNAVRMPVRGRPVSGAGREVVPDVSGVEAPAPATAAKGQTGLGRVSEAAPSLEEITRQAKDAYKRTKESGVVVNEQSMDALKQSILGELEELGMNDTLYPRATAALKDVLKSEGDLSLQKVENLRRIAKDAEATDDAADALRAGTIVDALDEYIDNLDYDKIAAGNPEKAKVLKEARALYTRQKKAEDIKEIFRLADLRKTGYSSSGYENALRNEFMKIATNKRRLRRFTKEEQAAIEKAAKGDNFSNAMRQLGKLAPVDRFGQVSAIIAALSAGPAALVIPAAGIGGRMIATRSRLRNARAVDELVRRGPQGGGLLGTVDARKGALIGGGR